MFKPFLGGVRTWAHFQSGEKFNLTRDGLLHVHGTDGFQTTPSLAKTHILIKDIIYNNLDKHVHV